MLLCRPSFNFTFIQSFGRVLQSHRSCTPIIISLQALVSVRHSQNTKEYLGYRHVPWSHDLDVGHERSTPSCFGPFGSTVGGICYQRVDDGTIGQGWVMARASVAWTQRYWTNMSRALSLPRNSIVPNASVSRGILGIASNTQVFSTSTLLWNEGKRSAWKTLLQYFTNESR